MLVEFASAVDAVTCAVVVQNKMAQRMVEGTQPRIQFRLGINVGDLIIDGDDIFGDGVNVAARVENECEPGGVCPSANAFEQVRGKTGFAFEDLGERSLKNIDRAVRLFAARAASPDSASKPSAEAAAKPLALPDKPSIAGSPVPKHERRPRAGMFFRWRGRRHHHRAFPSLMLKGSDLVVSVDLSARAN
jgi:adenylate cyclase